MNPIEPQLLLLSISHQLCPCHALSAATLCVFEHHTACGKERNELQTVNAWCACARCVQGKKTLFHSGVSATRYSAYLQLNVKDPDFCISEHSISRFCWHPKAAKTGQNSKENKVAHLPILFPYSAGLDLLWPYWGRENAAKLSDWVPMPICFLRNSHLLEMPWKPARFCKVTQTSHVYTPKTTLACDYFRMMTTRKKSKNTGFALRPLLLSSPLPSYTLTFLVWRCSSPINEHICFCLIKYQWENARRDGRSERVANLRRTCEESCE